MQQASATPPPTDEEIKALTALYANVYVLTEQREEILTQALIRLRAERAKDGA